MGPERYVAFAKKNRFDWVFNATSCFVEDFKAAAGESLWLPNAYDSFLIDRLVSVPKTIPLGFCGNVVNRGEWIDYLKKRYGLRHDRMVIGADMVRAVNSYQTHWNLNVSIDINYRTFETMGCRTLLLTNYSPDLPHLFDLDRHLLCYRNKADLDHLIGQVVSNPEHFETIAGNGYDHVKAHHTYVNRARTILEKIELISSTHNDDGVNVRQYKKNDLPARIFTAQYGEEVVLWRYFKNKKRGFLVDIGAADGVRYSNSRYLIKYYDWRGILVEPHPEFVKRLALLYDDQPDISICPYAIAEKEEIRPFFMYGKDKHAQVSTLSENFRDRAIARHGDKYLPPIKIQTKPIRNVLQELNSPREIDFMSVDCEGTDMQVLRSMDWENYRVKLVCVEHSMERDGLTQFMQQKGFAFFDATEGNSFFFRTG
ncbi:FkbM family methyltransferase [Desulfosarcina alkanivorans]|nr:FkbM family methyltransferase [Desulfosarcina alkanivorans]